MEYLHQREENYYTELTVTDVLITFPKPSYYLYKPIYTTVVFLSPFFMFICNSDYYCLIYLVKRYSRYLQRTILTPILSKLLEPFICLNKNNFPAYQEINVQETISCIDIGPFDMFFVNLMEIDRIVFQFLSIQTNVQEDIL